MSRSRHQTVASNNYMFRPSWWPSSGCKH